MEIKTDPLFIGFIEGRNLSKRSRQASSRGLGLFLKYYSDEKCKDVDLSTLIEMVKEELRKDISERGQIEQDWVGFARWLEKGGEFAPGSIKLYAAMVRSFLVFNFYPFTGRSKLPQSIRTGSEKQVNRKFNYRPRDVKKLLDVATSLRDRAIILTIFQSGMDLSTALSLNISHVQDELDKSRIPLLIHLERKKSNTLYRTCLGVDAVEAIKLYLRERSLPRYRCKVCSHTRTRKRRHCDLPKCNGEVEEFTEELTYDSPLFIQTRNKRLSGEELMAVLRQYVTHSAILSRERIKRATKNPAGTHALRSAMSSILQFHGVNQEIINGFLGHRVPYDSAYSRLGDEELRTIYSDVEEHLSVTGATDTGEMAERVKELEADVEFLKKELAGMKSSHPVP